VKFYDLPASPNARRVRIFMAEKCLDIPTQVVDMMKGENNEPKYLAKNSLGKMPLLELDDGTFIAESGAICRYLEELHPEPNLMGRNPLQRAQVEMWHRRAEMEFLLPIISIFLNTAKIWEGRLTQVPAWAEVVKTRLGQSMTWLDQELDGKDYLAGADYTVADIVAQSAFVMAKAALKMPIPEDLTNLDAWWDRVTARPTARA
jgi:glutathione S-transferase